MIRYNVAIILFEIYEFINILLKQKFLTYFRKKEFVSKKFILNIVYFGRISDFYDININEIINKKKSKINIFKLNKNLKIEYILKLLLFLNIY